MAEAIRICADPNADYDAQSDAVWAIEDAEAISADDLLLAESLLLRDENVKCHWSHMGILMDLDPTGRLWERVMIDRLRTTSQPLKLIESGTPYVLRHPSREFCELYLQRYSEVFHDKNWWKWDSRYWPTAMRCRWLLRKMQKQAGT